MPDATTGNDTWPTIRQAAESFDVPLRQVRAWANAHSADLQVIGDRSLHDDRRVDPERVRQLRDAQRDNLASVAVSHQIVHTNGTAFHVVWNCDEHDSSVELFSNGSRVQRLPCELVGEPSSANASWVVHMWLLNPAWHTKESHNAS